MRLSADRSQRGWLVGFATVWIGQAGSLLGSELVQFALIWHLTATTGSATVVAMAALVALFPRVVLGPFAGALVDRWNRRRVMIYADALVAVAALVLAILFALNRARVGHIYLLIFIRAAGGAFHMPAMNASTSLMVPQRHLSRVQGLNQSLTGITQIGAPVLGALLLVWLPMEGILAIDIGTAVLAIASLYVVRIPQPQKSVPPRESLSLVRRTWHDLREGLHFIVNWPGVGNVLALALTLNFLLAPALALAPVLVRNHFEGGALHLAWLQGAWGLGMVAGGLTMGAWGGFRRRIVTVLVSTSGMGLCALALGLIPSHAFPLALPAAFGAAMLFVWANATAIAIMQQVVPPEIQGRVFALSLALANLAVPLGLGAAGPIGDLLGVRVWLWIAGVGMFLLGIGGFAVPSLINIEESPPTDKAPDRSTAP